VGYYSVSLKFGVRSWGFVFHGGEKFGGNLRIVGRQVIEIGQWYTDFDFAKIHKLSRLLRKGLDFTDWTEKEGILRNGS
jgi:hypothetical protein